MVKFTLIRRVFYDMGGLLITLFILAALIATAVHGQTAPDQLTSTLETSIEPDHVTLGAGVAGAPAREGGSHYRILPVPAIDIKYGRMFLNFENGLGAYALDSRAFHIGGSITYVPGYRTGDVPLGVGHLTGGAGARVFAGTELGGFIFNTGITKSFSGGAKGIIIDARLGYPIQVTERLSLIPSIQTSWADSKYNDRYFGISTSQSLASGLGTYRPDSGFKDASAFLGANYRLTDRLGLGASAGVSRVLGNDANSPLVTRRTAPIGFLSLTYRLFGKASHPADATVQ